MSEAEEYRRKSEDFLRKATLTDDLGERSRLLTAAAHWNNEALEAEARARAERRDDS